MKPIIIPETYNYIAAFLTLHCNLHCSYCINRHGNFKPRPLMSGKEWIAAINRIESRPDLPVTLQGGEPTLHPDFYYIVNAIKPELNLDLLTNCSFDIFDFRRNIKPERFKRNASYASIRVSYHPEQMDMDSLAYKVLWLKDAGYSIGIWSVDHPKYKDKIEGMKMLCDAYGINFLTKEFLGEYQGKFYGHYKYSDACGQDETKKVSCRTTELLVSPDGKIYRCHADLYAERDSIGSVKENYIIQNAHRDCFHYGKCNPCDVKIKFDRFGNKGWTSTDIIRAEIENG